MKLFFYTIILSVVMYAKISSAIQTVGTEVSITDITPNVATVGQSSEILIKGDGFTKNTTVIITPDITHEALKESIYSLPEGLAAQESYVYEDKLYIGYGDDAESKAGILVYDLSNDLKNPTLLYNNNDTNLTFINSLVRNGDKLYVSDDSGLFVYDLSANSSMVYSNSYATTSPVRNVKFSTEKIITTFSPNNSESNSATGLLVFDNNLNLINEYDTNGSSWGVDIKDDFAYIADGDNGLLVLDINDGSVKGHYITNSVHSVVVDDTYAYLGKFSNGIEIVNISNLESITSTDIYSTNGQSHKIKLENSKLIIANLSNGILILDVEDKENIKKFASFNAPGDTYSVDSYADYGYSANGFNGIVISDISKPNSLDDMILSSAKTDGYANSVTVDGNISYFTYTNLGESEGGVVVTDLSKLEQPEYKTSFRPLFKTIADSQKLTLTKISDENITIKEDINLQSVTFDGDNNRTLSTANQIFVKDGLAYVADAYGLIIYDVENNVSLGSSETFNLYGCDNDGCYSSNSDAVAIQVVENLNIEGTVYEKVAILAHGTGSVALIDVNDTSAISPIYYDYLSQNGVDQYSAKNAIVKDNILYMTTYESVIVKIDLENYTLEGIGTKEKINSITFDNSYAYISAGYDGVLITPENNLSNIIGSYDTPDFAWYTSIKGDIAYIADSYSGIVMIDISDKTNPLYMDTIKISGDTRDFDFIDSSAALLVSSQFGGVTTLDSYLETTIVSQSSNELLVNFPNYRMLGDYNVKVVNNNENYSRVAGAITLISEAEKTSMPTLNLQLRTKDGKDGDITVDGQSMIILNALLSYDSTITNIFKELTTSQYQLTSSDKSIAQIYGNKVVFYNNGKVTISIAAKGLTDSITFDVSNIEPIKVSIEENVEKMTNSQALIIVGHIDESNTPDGLTVSNTKDALRYSINKIGNDIYKTLIKFGLSSDDIFYFNPNGEQKILDINNDKKKDDITYNSTNFDWEDITTLVDSLNADSSKPLIIYMVDHGSINEIKIAANKSVSSIQIKTLIDDFQAKTERKVVAVFDACYSGSIFDDLNNDNSGYSRVIISSSDSTNPTYMDPYGISFSKYFIQYMKQGNGLKDAFDKSNSKFNTKLKKYKTKINPQYYATNDKVQKISDYSLIYGLPDFNNYTAKDENLTYEVETNKVKTLDLNITLNYPKLAKAYALILPPVAPIDVGSAKIINSEKVELNYDESSEQFSENYTFDKDGVYAINYLVEDDEENMILSDLVYINIDKSATLTKENLDYSDLLNNNTSSINIISNLELLTTSSYGATIVWDSNDTSIISSDGIVIQPSFENGDKTVILTATIKSKDNSVILTKEFTFTVVAKAYSYKKLLKLGWNLIGIEYFDTLNYDNIKYTFTYKDNNWEFYSESMEIDAYPKISKVNENQGYWVYVTKEFELNYTKNETPLDLSSLNSSWSLLSSNAILDITSIQDTFSNQDIELVWRCKNNIENQENEYVWEYYSNDYSIVSAATGKYNMIQSLDNYEGFWVKHK